MVHTHAFPIRIKLGNNVHIEPSATLHGEISLDDDCWIGSNVTIHDGARISKRVKIFPGAVISAIPQDLKFAGEKTTLEVGDDTVIRECATLNRGTTALGKTVVGKNCLIMAYVHVAHDCIVGNNVILANAVNLAGHVEIGDWAILGGLVGCHQFVRIGAHSIIAAGVTVRKDVPPFIKAGREPIQYAGVNSIGLRRRGFEAETINHIQEIYRHIFVTGKNTAKAIEHVVTQIPFSDERDTIVNFVRNSERGILKGV
ncbi:MAG: acyl-ACP--UDP-N-acetylglucosamine O-acyltransferase [Bacteroidia bacterium]